MFKYRLIRTTEKLKLAIVWRLPNWVVYWCTIRSGAYATTGEHSSQVVPDLTLINTLKRWEDKSKE